MDRNQKTSCSNISFFICTFCMSTCRYVLLDIIFGGGLKGIGLERYNVKCCHHSLACHLLVSNM